MCFQNTFLQSQTISNARLWPGVPYGTSVVAVAVLPRGLVLLADDEHLHTNGLCRLLEGSIRVAAHGENKAVETAERIWRAVDQRVVYTIAGRTRSLLPPDTGRHCARGTARTCSSGWCHVSVNHVFHLDDRNLTPTLGRELRRFTADMPPTRRAVFRRHACRRAAPAPSYSRTQQGRWIRKISRFDPAARMATSDLFMLLKLRIISA